MSDHEVHSDKYGGSNGNYAVIDGSVSEWSDDASASGAVVSQGSSARSRSLAREPGKSERAISFETPRNGGERVRLALDVDPSYSDSIMVSEPDGRSYDDGLPELPLPGSGEKYEECGDDVPALACKACGSPTWIGSTCRRSVCPRCWKAWAFYQGIEAVTAIDGTRRKRAAEPGPNPYNHHIVVSPPEGTRFNSADALGRGKEAAKRFLMEIAADTGMILYHPYRIKEEHRGDVFGHESGDGELHWKDVLAMARGEREEYLVHSPHFHVFAVSDFVQGGAVTRQIEEETGVVIERIADDDGVSLGDLDALAAAVAYSLSHTGLRIDEAGARRAAYWYFGETANIERRANVRADAKEAMRRVAFDVLGVSFGQKRCRETVVETPDSVVESSREHGGFVGPSSSSSTPMTPGETVDGDGFPTGAESSWLDGNSGGFATGSDTPDARGFNSARSGGESMAGHGHNHDHEEDGECGGSLVPIWKAPEMLADNDWREQIGEETAERLQAAYDEWVEMGKPIPEDLPPDADPPPDAGGPPPD